MIGGGTWEGAHARHEATGVRQPVRRRGSRVADRSARAAVGSARGRLITGFSADAAARYVAAFRKGLNQTGHVEGQDVTVEYHWLEGHYDRLPALMADLVHRQVAVIATPASTVSSLAAKAATATIPIVFSVPADPIPLGLVANLARPGGNATGINFFNSELAAKRLDSCTTWCQRPFVLPCSSIRPISRLPRARSATPGSRTRNGTANPDDP